MFLLPSRRLLCYLSMTVLGSLFLLSSCFQTLASAAYLFYSAVSPALSQSSLMSSNPTTTRLYYSDTEGPGQLQPVPSAPCLGLSFSSSSSFSPPWRVWLSARPDHDFFPFHFFTVKMCTFILFYKNPPSFFSENPPSFLYPKLLYSKLFIHCDIYNYSNYFTVSQ